MGSDLPKPDLHEVKNQIYALTDCIDNNRVLSCHDISDGGIAVALAEMTFNNNIGCKVSIECNLRVDETLFSETGGFLLEASDENLDNITKCFSEYDLEVFVIGKTVSNNIMINDALNISIEQGRDAWENGLTNKL